MKTKLEIIEETAAYYCADPSRRSITETDTCVYLHLNGNRCAVGRYLIDPSKMINYDIWGLVDNDWISQEHFIEEVRGHDWEFWADLQIFHDSRLYWGIGGLTMFGNSYLNSLKKKYATENIF